MQLTIIKKNKLSIFVLPEKVSGVHWITDSENGKKINLISVEANDGVWNLISNHDAFVVDNNDVMIPNVSLKEYGFYLLRNNYKNEKYYIYVSPVYDTTFKELGVDSSISVGSDKGATISYNLGGIPKKAFVIEKKENSHYYLTITDQNSSVYVNQKRVLNTKRIEYGDIVFTFGLKIILMRKDGRDYVLVNNPNNLLNFNASLVNIVPMKNEFVEDNMTLSDDSVYADDNYFYRAPHFYNTLKKFTLNVDSPPGKKEDDKTPVALTIGPMITMAMTSVVTLITTMSSVGSGGRTIKDSIPSLVMAGAMLASCLLWPLLTKAYQKFSDKMYENKRQRLYKKYIDKKEKEIEKELESQRESLINNNFTVKECQDVIRGHNIKLWQRRVNDEDFLKLPVGNGNMPMQIEINYPEAHFTLSEDNLLDIAHTLGEKERILENVPIIYDFYTNNTTGIVGDSIVTKEFIDRLVLQIMANYSYDEVKLVTFTTPLNETDWDYIKTLPHSWSNDKTLRYFGSSNEDYREIIYSLEKLYNERKQNGEDDKKFLPHYVIITDAIKSIDSYDFLKEVMNNGKYYGFSIVMLVDKVAALPNECKNFINVSNDECSIYSSVINVEAQKFKIDFSPIDDIYNSARELANIPINIKSEVEMSLPEVYQFLEMYQVGKVEQLNSEVRWKKSNPILSLQAPIGIGKSGEVLTLDLHEKYHGPHGLIAGTTGSGKSEFIITYILSLAVNYHPNEVQIILIDYKGGSLAGAFQNDKYSLPHLAGTITNLDGNELNRSLASIESEIKRRQSEFNDARIMTNESTVDIYKYQKLWREGKLKGKDPIAHLFIISDEFAELKEQQPEFMEKLISAARVGRSLGVHLILATQKPGGVVDPQIWSNTRFRVCLKVQDTGDSQEVLKKADAAYLKKTGRFYLQVGYDEVYTLGQSAWAGAQYIPSNTFKREVDTSVSVINNIGFVTTSKDIEVTEVRESHGEELANVVKYLSDIGNSENIRIRKLWLPKIPEKIYVDDLKSKYNYEKTDFLLDPIIGEYDDPESQNQFALKMPLSKHGNALIYGITGSGKENMLSTLIYSCMSSYTVEEVNFYVLDFGSETMGVFKDSPYVGDVAFVNDTDKVYNLFKLINEEVNTRKKEFSNYGGSYQGYIESSGKKVPSIVVIINNYEALLENFEELGEELNQISREAFRYGIYFVVTAGSDSSVRMKTKQNFSLVYVLQQNNDSDYSSILGNIRGKVPARYKGRGLFKSGSIYEFQTAYVANESSYLKEYISNQLSNITFKAKRIPILPEVVNYESVSESLTLSPNMVVGINKNNLNVTKYDFSRNAINLVSSYEIENTVNFVNALVNETLYLGVYQLMFVNATDISYDNVNLNGKVITKEFSENLVKIMDYIDKVYKVYEESQFNDEVLKNQRKYMFVINGVYDFINKLSSEVKLRLGEVMKKDNQMGLVSFVLIDNPDVLKGFAYEDWFKNGCDNSRGIFIGSGVTEQSLFRISSFDREDREEISNEFGYVIQSSKLYKVKLLSNFEK